MKSLFAYHPQENACNLNRIGLPAIFCKPIDCKIDLGIELPKNGGKYNSVMVHGIYPPESMIEYLRLKLKGKNFIWAIDDDYLTIPKWNGNYLTEELKEFHDLVTAFADSIIVSTEHLKSKFKRTDVFVCPNLIDLSKFSVDKKENKKIVILWQGSSTHKEDIELVVPALSHVLTKYPDRISVVMFGGTCPVDLCKFLYNGLTLESPVKITHYYSKLQEINPDIILAPLVDCEFNKSKSNLRVLEGWAGKCAVLASNVEPYAKTIVADKTGLIANNSNEFINQLEVLINEETYRKSLAECGRICVEEDYSWQNPICRNKWDSVFTQIV